MLPAPQAPRQTQGSTALQWPPQSLNTDRPNTAPPEAHLPRLPWQGQCHHTPRPTSAIYGHTGSCESGVLSWEAQEPECTGPCTSSPMPLQFTWQTDVPATVQPGVCAHITGFVIMHMGEHWMLAALLTLLFCLRKPYSMPHLCVPLASKKLCGSACDSAESSADLYWIFRMCQVLSKVTSIHMTSCYPYRHPEREPPRHISI